MAINDHPTIDCAANWQHAPGHPAVAFVIGDRMESDGEWWPRCQSCLDELAADPDPLPHGVVYLDPTRQRRPQPDHDRPTANKHIRATLHWTPVDPAPGHHPGAP